MFLLEISFANLPGAILSQYSQSKWSEVILQLMKSFFRFLLIMSNNWNVRNSFFFLSGRPKKGKGYNFLRFIIAPPLLERYVGKIFMAINKGIYGRWVSVGGHGWDKWKCPIIEMSENQFFCLKSGLGQAKVDHWCLSLTWYSSDQKRGFIALFFVFIYLESSVYCISS